MMKNLIIATLLLFAALPASASISINHSNHGNASSSGGTISFSVTSTTGNLYVIAAASASTGVSIDSVTDNQSNTYVAVDNNATDANSGDCRIFYVKAPTTGVTSVTVHVSNNGTFIDAFFYDLAGADTTAPLEAHNTLSSQASTTNPVGPSITPATDGGFAVAVCDPQQSVTAVASPFTGDSINGTNVGDTIAHDLYATAGNLNPSWTQSPAGTWDAAIAAFKPSGGAAPPPPAPNKRMKLEQFDNLTAVWTGGGIQATANVLNAVMGPCDPADINPWSCPS